MTATLDQPGTTVITASATTAVMTFGINPKRGTKVIVLVVSSSQPTGVADNGSTVTNFVVDSAVSGGGLVTSVWHGDTIYQPSSGGYTVTATFSGTVKSTIAGGAWWGLAPGTPMTTQLSSGTATSTSVSSGAVSTVEPATYALYVGVFGDASALNPETITPTWTSATVLASQTNGSAAGYCAGFSYKASLGAQTATWTLGDSVLWQSILLAYPVTIVTPSPIVPLFQPGFGPQQGDFAALWPAAAGFAQQRVVARMIQQTTTTTLASAFATSTTIGYDTVLEDPYNGWNNSSHVWFAPTGYSGYYLVTAQVFTAASSTAGVGLLLNILCTNTNSAAFIITVTMLPTATVGCGEAAALIYLVGGQDGVYVTAQQQNATNTLATTSATFGQQSTLDVVWVYG
jgi:hypothetical protein